MQFLFSIHAIMRLTPRVMLLLTPLIINFAKISFAAYQLPIADFGRYTLYVGLSSALTYILNSGLYEGHLNYFSILQHSLRSRRISWLQVRAEFVSFILLIFALFITKIGLWLFDPKESIFVLAMVIASHVQAHSNLITAHDRSINNLMRVGVILSCRSILSATLFIGFIVYGEISVGEAYLYENIIISLTFSIYFSLRFRFRNKYLCISFSELSRHNLLIFKTVIFRKTFSCTLMSGVFNPLYIIKRGVWQCYTSSVRSIFFAIERYLASLLLSPQAMGEYGILLLVYQLMITIGGVISQLVQYQILFDALSNGIKAKGIQLLKYQGAIIGVMVITVSVLFFLVPNSFIHLVSSIVGSEIPICGASAIFLAGLISGTNLIDSLALGSSKGLAFIRIQVLCGLSWIVLFAVSSSILDTWTLNQQAIMLLALIGFFLLGNVRFVKIH